MSKVVAIIGSGYGDEGKGLMTDYYSSKMDDSIVVRSNGGAQAGHTVVTPTGERHVFSHLGSGTFNGRATYLSEYFVANPSLLAKELKVFDQVSGGMKINIFAHPDTLITTPFDMLINQRFETERGAGFLHGSVGVGFGETLEREKYHSALTFGDLLRMANAKSRTGADVFVDELYMFMRRIREEYVPTRVNLNKVLPNFIEILNNDDMIYEAINQLRSMLKVVKIADYRMLRNTPLIFEGAQGLLLDMDYGYFPHVTRSNCGMKNVSAILDQIPGEHDVTVNYVTRAYSTRHGAGPFDHEDDLIPKRHNIIDNTNVLNDWQGELRFAPLNFDLFNSATDKDFLNYAPRSATKTTTMTCLDQLVGEVTMIEHGKTHLFGLEVFKHFVPYLFDFNSWGPTREDVRNRLTLP